MISVSIDALPCWPHGIVKTLLENGARNDSALLEGRLCTITRSIHMVVCPDGGGIRKRPFVALNEAHNVNEASGSIITNPFDENIPDWLIGGVHVRLESGEIGVIKAALFGMATVSWSKTVQSVTPPHITIILLRFQIYAIMSLSPVVVMWLLRENFV